MISARNSRSTMLLDVENEISGNENDEAEIEEKPEKRYDAFDLDD